jgi:hypothetical protein
MPFSVAFTGSSALLQEKAIWKFLDVILVVTVIGDNIYFISMDNSMLKMVNKHSRVGHTICKCPTGYFVSKKVVYNYFIQESKIDSQQKQSICYGFNIY